MWDEEEDRLLSAAMDNTDYGEPARKKGRLESDDSQTAFGNITSLRFNQEQIIKATLEKRDTLIVMPTGQGKSLCFQLPAVLADGVTIVVTPLKSLMNDQTSKLTNIGIKVATFSEGSDYKKIIADLKGSNPKIKLLYTTPEMLCTSQTLKAAIESLRMHNKLAHFVFDEAHCIVSWGNEFRPAYKKLMWLHNTYPNVPFMALTATATPETKLRIERLLGLKNVMSVDRPNIKYTVLNSNNETVTNVAENIKRNYPNCCGIVYCITRDECEKVTAKLRAENITCHAYHAGISQNMLQTAHKLWMDGDVQVMVATNAFGMGIDKPNVRFVYHLHIPKSIEEYYQECGRAGRDGQYAECILLYKLEDATTWFKLLENNSNNKIYTSTTGYNMEHVKSMIRYATNVNECRRLQLLKYFGEDQTPTCSAYCCDNYTAKEMHTSIDTAMQVRSVMNLLEQKDKKFTAKQLIDILKGSRQKALTSHGFNLLRQYGMMNNWKSEDLTTFIAYLYTHGFINFYPVRNAYNVAYYLKPETNQSCYNDDFKFPVPTVNKKKEKKFKKNFDTCYDKLACLRTKIGYALGIEEQSIFDNTVLTYLALELPANMTEMLKVPGLTIQKYHMYGECILDITSQARTGIESD
ncbi:Bloom syndrome protein-like protein [Frankliniella fusca]|uniref:ATP-dependent DNA helicase n=1 Tax=Frankliniella fusca TaxID=407009 RepID=A0AAE1HHW6_9NEOP|nr:Bloom syndrome protein-like protein [Frankliniella fusca]